MGTPRWPSWTRPRPAILAYRSTSAGALTGLPPDWRRAEQAVADLEFVLAVRDQFPSMLLHAAHHGLAAAHAVLGQDDQATETERKSGSAQPGRSPMAVVSYQVIRDHFTERLYPCCTGSWSSISSSARSSSSSTPRSAQSSSRQAPT
jgi:hypothetical protein